MTIVDRSIKRFCALCANMRFSRKHQPMFLAIPYGPRLHAAKLDWMVVPSVHARPESLHDSIHNDQMCRWFAESAKDDQQRTRRGCPCRVPFPSKQTQEPSCRPGWRANQDAFCTLAHRLAGLLKGKLLIVSEFDAHGYAALRTVRAIASTVRRNLLGVVLAHSFAAAHQQGFGTLLAF